MSTFAVVPVKTLLKSKTRLSSFFTFEERRLFTLAMLEDVLSALKASSFVKTVVIGSDSVVQSFVKDFGMIFLNETGEGLNQALNQGIKWCVRNQAESVLVLPADIPLITPKDLDTLAKMASGSSVVVSPSRNGGTNALLLAPATVVAPSFGTNSFKRHINKAQAKHVRIKSYVSANMMLDIDSKADLEQLLGTGRQTVSFHFLKQKSWASSDGV